MDESTRLSLQKSVQLAIQITTQSQEARAKHDAHREEEEAKGMLERQRLANESQAESEKKHLLQLRAESAAVETSGQATAEARALAEARQIEVQTNTPYCYHQMRTCLRMMINADLRAVCDGRVRRR